MRYLLYQQVVVNIQVTYMEWSSLKAGNQALLCLAGRTVLTLVNPAAANAAQDYYQMRIQYDGTVVTINISQITSLVSFRKYIIGNGISIARSSRK